jgi:hypothetical protein
MRTVVKRQYLGCVLTWLSVFMLAGALVYREPVKSEGPLPLHLIPALKRSLEEDKFVADTGDIVFYQKPTAEAVLEPARR